MKKRIIVSIVIILILGFSLYTYYIDSARVRNNVEPKFTIKIINDKGNKVTYWGLGYKVIRYVGVSPKEPYQSNIGVKMGSWFMTYELPNETASEEIKTLDDFYNTELTKEKDIRNLGELYNSFDAQKDNCFVIGAMVHNDYLYYEFMNNFKNDKSSFVRVAQNTVEGDLFLYDILYHEETNKLYLVSDYTRDEFSASEDRIIKLRQYEGITEYTYNENLYWVLYNGELNDETFNSENVFIITLINLVLKSPYIKYRVIFYENL